MDINQQRERLEADLEKMGVTKEETATFIEVLDKLMYYGVGPAVRKSIISCMGMSWVLESMADMVRDDLRADI